MVKLFGVIFVEGGGGVTETCRQVPIVIINGTCSRLDGASFVRHIDSNKRLRIWIWRKVDKRQYYLSMSSSLRC